MPLPGRQWLHVVINTRCSWLPGDPRGFRNRKHRIHSSGDYKNLPPPGEHLGLHMYNQSRRGREVRIPPELRPRVGAAIVQWLQGAGYRLVALAVSGLHAHLLVELPCEAEEQRRIIGACKNAASRAVRREMPGAIWSRGGAFRPIWDDEHQQNTYSYILGDQGDGAWTWRWKGE